MKARRRWAILVGTTCLAMHRASVGQTCVADGWQRPFDQGIVGSASSHTVYDPDGAGPLPAWLVLLGNFQRAGGVAASRVISWDGQQWRAMDEGLSAIQGFHSLNCVGSIWINGPVQGGQLFLGGLIGDQALFMTWRESGWQQLVGPLGPFGFPGYGCIHKMIEFDADGTGPQPGHLYAAVSNLPAQGYSTLLRRWDGQVWHSTGVTIPGGVTDMLVVTHPAMNGLYMSAFGSLMSAVSYTVKRWSGTSEQTIASWSSSLQGLRTVNAMAYLESGPSPSLYVGGYFPEFGGVTTRGIARWDGAAWHAADAGLRLGGTVECRDLEVVDPDGEGGPASPTLFAAGELPSDVSGSGVVAWNGTSWSLSQGVGGASRTVAYDDGDGITCLYALGSFSVAGNQYATNIAKRVGVQWLPVGQCLTNAVHAMASVADPMGDLAEGVYAGGAFISAGRVLSAGIGHWNGHEWASLDGGMDHHVDALVVADVVGPSLVAGGRFTRAGNVFALRIARWDGTTWLAMGTGFNDRVSALAGAAGTLYAGGAFTATGLSPVHHVARWNGSAWAPCGSGINGDVFALAEFDEGNGPALVAGGNFSSPGSNIAKWTGTEWQPLGAGVNGPVYALASFERNGKPALFVGGAFTHAGLTPVSNIASWTPSGWSAVGAGLNGAVRAIRTFDVAGPGPRMKLLGVGGEFTLSGSESLSRVATWNGTNWSALASGMNGTVRSLAPFDLDGPGSLADSLMVGGDFAAGDGASRWIAEWHGCSPCFANCDMSTAPPILSPNDFICFLDKFAAGDPYANCDGSSVQPVLNANDFLCFLGAYATGCD